VTRVTEGLFFSVYFAVVSASWSSGAYNGRISTSCFIDFFHLAQL
jgi:hypothetical protein